MSSICDSPLIAAPIPLCTTNLVVGTVTSASTAVFVYIQSVATGELTRYSVTSNGAGLVTIPITKNNMRDSTYSLWITLASAGSMEDREDITVSGTPTATKCIDLHFEYVRDTAGDAVVFLNITIEAAA